MSNYRPGQKAPDMNQNPPVSRMDNDGDEVHEVNIMEYGDCYDSKNYQRTVKADKKADPDHDGKD